MSLSALGALFCGLAPDTKLFFGAEWQFRFALCFIPVVLYALLILPRTFPVNERVAAGVSYRDMLKEVGPTSLGTDGWLPDLLNSAAPTSQTSPLGSSFMFGY